MLIGGNALLKKKIELTVQKEQGRTAKTN